MKNISLILIKFYKIAISPVLELLFGKGCRFTPTCSEYCNKAIERYGLLKGGFMFIKRLAKCHPFSNHPHLDPLPEINRSY